VDDTEGAPGKDIVVTTSAVGIGQCFIDSTRSTLAGAMATIEHCLEQIPEADLQWRSFEGHNSASNIILHLCGNLRQWMIAGVGETEDRRDRPTEFTDRTVFTGAELLDRLRATVAEADAVLAAIAPEDLLDERRIQGFETRVLTAVMDTVGHFVGHAQEITYITRMRLGDAYTFKWVPQTAEQGAP